ncbi:F-box only protein 28 [Contarinia nasturtii]|uniref:F-box only protein 28 n=1 Tax=Contarinia nasturtii TaxID=265458 RepID=UPI0012D39B93|nr:F-box only protein 28 [Contarinia nasturtii]
MNLLDLPDCMLEQVLECLSYDEIAKQRIVCQKFNTICQGLLNVGFHKVMKRHGQLLKIIKSQLPRRESERRNHQLSKHSDVLTCIETRISMLSMTYTKYIEVNLCCFIPGKVIDEVLHVFASITHTKPCNMSEVFVLSDKPLRTHDVLQELRDISSMAIDHFEEKIAPTLKRAYCELPTRAALLNCSNVQYHYATDTSSNTSGLSLPALYSQFQQGASSSSSSSSPPQKAINARQVDPYQSNYIRMERKFKTAMRKLNNVIGIQNRQAQKLRSCSMQINELNAQVIDLRRRLEESNNSKNSLEQIASVVKVRSTQSNTQHNNIKPRTATIILKRIAETSSGNPTATKKAKH